MVNTISPYFDDSEIITNLRCFFDYDEMWDFDSTVILGQIVDKNDVFYLEFRNRRFNIDKITGAIVEVS